MQKKPEIMSPAGNRTCLTAALHAGADAVYFGVEGFNMRANSRNFRPSEMKDIARACHDAGAKAYLALNTIIHENELAKVDRILASAAEAGIDSVICWDMAVIHKARALGLPVFLSTQMSVSNSAALAAYFRAFGIRRFVLARECSLQQIRSIRRHLTAELGADADRIEIEVFAHGAMCVSISGRCFMSESGTGKSANRGACTQPCRREYQLIDDQGKTAFRMGGNYVLSPEDLCTMPFLEQLIGAGVSSLKIEGRARTPEYVSTVTAAYRRAVDFHHDNHRKRGFQAEFQALKDSLMLSLDQVYHRGLSSGFFLGKPLDQWANANGNRASGSKRQVGEVMNYYRKAGCAEIQVTDVGFSTGDELMIQGPTTGVVRVTVGSIQIEHQSIDIAKRGERVAVLLNEPVRPRDRVFLVCGRR
jgi:putative protease